MRVLAICVGAAFVGFGVMAEWFTDKSPSQAFHWAVRNSIHTHGPRSNIAEFTGGSRPYRAGLRQARLRA
jgi:hypothetical protein